LYFSCACEVARSELVAAHGAGWGGEAPLVRAARGHLIHVVDLRYLLDEHLAHRVLLVLLVTQQNHLGDARWLICRPRDEFAGRQPCRARTFHSGTSSVALFIFGRAIAAFAPGAGPPPSPVPPNVLCLICVLGFAIDGDGPMRTGPTRRPEAADASAASSSRARRMAGAISEILRDR